MESDVNFPGFRDRFNKALDAVDKKDLPKKTQKAVGEFFGVTEIGARHWLKGEKLPSIKNAVYIAEKTGFSVEWLLTGRGDERPVNFTVTIGEIAKLSATLSPARQKIVVNLIQSLRSESTEENEDCNLTGNNWASIAKTDDMFSEIPNADQHRYEVDIVPEQEKRRKKDSKSRGKKELVKGESGGRKSRTN